jgi:branched-chain amino acid transport system substrate-binding protein
MKIWRNRRPGLGRLGMVVALVALMIAGCGGNAAGDNTRNGNSTSFDLTIGHLVSQTGDLSVSAASSQRNAKLAVDLTTAALRKAGIGVNIKLETADDQTQAQGAISGARQLLANGADCIVAPLGSANTIAVAQAVTIRAHVPIITPGGTAAQITTLKDDGTVFRVTPSDALATKALASVASNTLGGAQGKSISLAARNDDYGTAFVKSFQDEWTALGGNVQGPVIYDPGASSYDSEAQKIVSGNPDAWAIIDYPGNYARLGPALMRTGKFHPDRMFVSDAMVGGLDAGVPPEIMEGATGARASVPSAADTYKAYAAAYEAAYPGQELGSFGPQVFDAVTMCVLGGLAARSADPAKIAAALPAVSKAPGTQYDYRHFDQAFADLAAGKDVDFNGVTGPINWDANGDITAGTFSIITYKKAKPVEVRQIQAGTQQ